MTSIVRVQIAQSPEMQQLLEENALLKQRLREAREQIHILSRDRVFEILTREALEQQWKMIGESYPIYSAIFLDLDNLKGLNTKYGHAGVNAKIHAALHCVRSTEIVGRWFSGDEFVLLVRSGLTLRVMARLYQSFEEQGLSFTAASGQCMSAELAECVQPLIDRVMELKSERVSTS